MARARGSSLHDVEDVTHGAARGALELPAEDLWALLRTTAAAPSTSASA
ncbi:MAG: hypothetical protein OXH52_05735 [Gammaproteobacteria bacterium]|nr:hypothetical protein [Gammaproteobacteria bacterium]